MRKKKFKRGDKYSTYYYLEKQEKVGGKFKTKTVKYLGTAEKILETYKEPGKLKKIQKSV